MIRRFVLAAGLAAALGPALAQEGSGCDGFKWAGARERAAFATPGLEPVDPGKPLPGIMDPANIRLKPVGRVALVMARGHKARPETFGAGIKTAAIVIGGTYQITLSDDAWIDVIQGGGEIRSTAFTGAKGCPLVRKSVRFTFAAGDATIQISGAPADSIRLDLLPPE